MTTSVEIIPLNEHPLIESFSSNRKQFCEKLGIEPQYYKYFQKPLVTDIESKINRKRATIGDRAHEYVLAGYLRPRSLAEILFRGDRFTHLAQGEYLITSEMKLRKGGDERRADIIIFQRSKFENHILWVPILVLDLKTRIGINFDFMGKSSRTNKRKINLHPMIEERPLREPEWHKCLNEKLPKRVVHQLNVYQSYCENEVKRLTKNSLNFPPATGIILLDPVPEQGPILDHWDQVKNQLEVLIHSILQANEGVQSNKIYQLDDKSTNLAIFMNSTGRSSHKISKFEDQGCNTLDTQSSNSINQSIARGYLNKYAEREHILYLAASSNCPSGNSAAWIGGITHLVQHIVRTHPNQKIAILDLMGIFNKFVNQRFRTNVQFQKYLTNISIISWSDLFAIKEIPELDQRFDVYCIIGWSLFVQSDTENEKTQLELEILSKIPSQSTVYWMDEPVPDILHSDKYQMRTLLPYYGKDRKKYITQIIWNLPLMPKKGHKAPKFTDVRAILHHKATGKPKKQVVVCKPLRGHHQKHYNSRRPHRSRRPDINRTPGYANQLIAGAFNLVPWLAPEFGYQIPLRDPISTENLDIIAKPLNVSPRTKYDFISHEPISKREKRMKQLGYHSKTDINSSQRQFIPHSQNYEKGRTMRVFRDLIPKINHPQLDEREIKTLRLTSNFLRKKELLDASILDVVSNNLQRGVVEVGTELHEHLIRNDIEPEILRMFYFLRNRLVTKVTSDNSPYTKRWLIQYLKYFGNSFLLFLLALRRINFEYMDLEILWNAYSPWIYHTIGYQFEDFNSPFEPSYSSYLIWTNLKFRCRIINQHPPRILGQRIGSIVWGRSISWFNIENEESGDNQNWDTFPVYNYRRGLLYANEMPYTIIEESEILNEEQDFVTSEKAVPTRFGWMKGKQHVWAFEATKSSWQILGIYERRGLKIWMTPSMKFIDPKWNPHDVTIEKIQKQSKVDQLPSLGAILTYDRRISCFILKVHVKEPYELIEKMHFDSTHDLLDNLKERHQKIIEYKDIRYRFKVDRNVNFGSFEMLRGWIWNEKTDLVNDADLFVRLNYSNLSGAYVLKVHRILNVQVRHDPLVCPIKDIPYEEVVKNVRKLGQKRELMRLIHSQYRHEECWKLEVLNSDFKLERTHYYTKDLLNLYQRVIIESKYGELCLLEWDFQSSDENDKKLHPVLQEDPDMVWLIKMACNIQLRETDPNSHKEEAKYVFRGIKSGDNADEIQIYRVYDGSIHSILINHHKHPCIDTKLIEAKLNNFIEDYSTGFDDLEWLIVEEELSWYWDRISEHESSCRECINIDDGENYVLVKEFYIKNEQIVLKVEPVYPIKRNHVPFEQYWPYDPVGSGSQLGHNMIELAKNLIRKGKQTITEEFGWEILQDDTDIINRFSSDLFDSNHDLDLPVDQQNQLEFIISFLDVFKEDFVNIEEKVLIDNYLQIEYEYNKGSYQFVLDQSSRLIEILEERNYFVSYLYLAHTLIYRGLSKNRFRLYSEALKDFELAEDVYARIGTINEISEFVGSLRYKKVKFHGVLFRDAVYALRYQGRMYSNMGRWETAKHHVEQVLTKSKKYGVKNDLSEDYNILGVLNDRLGDYETSIQNFEDSLSMIEPTDLQKIVTRTTNLSKIDRKIQNFQRSLDRCFLVIKQNKIIEDSIEYLIIHETLSHTYTTMGDTNRSLTYHKIVYNLIQGRLHDQKISDTRKVNSIFYLVSTLIDNKRPIEASKIYTINQKLLKNVQVNPDIVAMIEIMEAMIGIEQSSKYTTWHKFYTKLLKIWNSEEIRSIYRMHSILLLMKYGITQESTINIIRYRDEFLSLGEINVYASLISRIDAKMLEVTPKKSRRIIENEVRLRKFYDF